MRAKIWLVMIVFYVLCLVMDSVYNGRPSLLADSTFSALADTGDSIKAQGSRLPSIFGGLANAIAVVVYAPGFLLKTMWNMLSWNFAFYAAFPGGSEFRYVIMAIFWTITIHAVVLRGR